MRFFTRQSDTDVAGRKAIIPPINEDGWPILATQVEEFSSDPLTVLYEDGAWCIEGDLEELWDASAERVH